MTKERSQTDAFKEAARALDYDDDPECYRARPGKRVKYKSVEKSE